MGNIRESVLFRAFVEAWNMVVKQQDDLKERWSRMEKEGTELEACRARQMRQLVAEGPMQEAIPELVQAVLEHMEVKENSIEVYFLDGTAYEIR